MRPLDGRRVALLESRKGSELAALVHRLGGTTVSAPSVQEIARFEDVDAFVEGLTAGRFRVVVLLTAVGATSLLDEADHRGVLSVAVQALRATTLACRGPKPIAALKKYGLLPQIITAKPHTSRELLDALQTVDLQGAGVLLVHYGERNEPLAEALRTRGATLTEACPYEWALPADLRPMLMLIEELIAGRVDALLVTSQVQCRHLIQVATAQGRKEALIAALNRDVVLGAVGPVCADAMRALGLTPDVTPAAPNMASLVTAMGDYFELTAEIGRLTE